MDASEIKVNESGDIVLRDKDDKVIVITSKTAHAIASYLRQPMRTGMWYKVDPPTDKPRFR